MIDVAKLNLVEMDLLKEIGNIGCAHAATAISELIKKKINIAVPDININEISDLMKVLHDTSDKLSSNDKVVAIYLELTQGFSGSILFVFPSKSALALSDVILGRTVGTTKEIGDNETSALKEVGNIVVSAYANALGDFLNVRVMLTTPTFTYSVPEGVIKSIEDLVSPGSSHAVIFNTQLSESDNLFKSYFVLLPSPSSLESLINMLLA